MISDGRDGTATATVIVTTSPLTNNNPIANGDWATALRNSGPNAINVLANDTDADGDQLLVAALGRASRGKVALIDGMVTYTPTPNVFGVDRFTYTIIDGRGGIATGTVTITVKKAKSTTWQSD